MIVSIGTSHLELVQGDITAQHVDAIANAANSALQVGGGVDGAIHQAGGPDIAAELERNHPEGCAVGSAVSSTAGRLSARYVFHAVGPRWRGGREGEAELLASAYRSCLKLAVHHHCASIAFPAISTGIYGYPVDQAAAVALKATLDFVKWHKEPELVRFVLFDAGTLGAFTRMLNELVPH